jgi:hypothetical protein
MYWSGCQSTGAEMRKYLTAAVSVVKTNQAMHCYCSMRDWTAAVDDARTVVDLLKRNDAVRREALLGVLV